MSDRLTVIGTISAIYKNERNYKVVVEGEDYYTKGNKYPLKVEKGQEVKVVYEENAWKDKVFKNIESIKATGNASQAQAKPAPRSSGGSKPAVDWDAKDRKIIRQCAFKGAVETVELALGHGALKLPSKAADKMGVLTGAVKHLTDEFASHILEEKKELPSVEESEESEEDTNEWLNG